MRSPAPAPCVPAALTHPPSPLPRRWPFELVAVSDEKGMGLMLDHARAMLRLCCEGIIDRAFLQSLKMLQINVTMKTMGFMKGSKNLQEEFSMKDLERHVDDFRKWLVKKRDKLPERLSLTVYAPRGPALRLAKSMGDKEAAKVKGEWGKGRSGASWFIRIKSPVSRCRSCFICYACRPGHHAALDAARGGGDPGDGELHAARATS